MTADEREPETSGPPLSSAAASPPGLTPGRADIRAAWIEFYDAHYHRVVRFVMHYGASPQDACDAAQEAFTESWALMDNQRSGR
jgi:DNA-directed RNA polymerase specialized sigma24 family protein